jgi:hypothetical protein
MLIGFIFQIVVLRLSILKFKRLESRNYAIWRVSIENTER